MKKHSIISVQTHPISAFFHSMITLFSRLSLFFQKLWAPTVYEKPETVDPISWEMLPESLQKQCSELMQHHGLQPWHLATSHPYHWQMIALVIDDLKAYEDFPWQHFIAMDLTPHEQKSMLAYLQEDPSLYGLVKALERLLGSAFAKKETLLGLEADYTKECSLLEKLSTLSQRSTATHSIGAQAAPLLLSMHSAQPSLTASHCAERRRAHRL